ncbi:uncharacterized protein LOC126736392 isoform X2 [Anthonomus grandis grandis]|uniref:uncharacterized protein LOC126736392 isoform X2 n=1 Tax=Anthonomus grandis grandis TaxID=2921223 RepID=UPI00216527B6|nr:uncharacterized protein LOC126736392 isoform X2 [Anthonomus grandis grandis]
MAIHIYSGKNNLDQNFKNSRIQSVPFKIQADCDAPVSSYFEPYVRTTDSDILTASFRGYPLKGKKLDLSEGYVGLVLHESVKPTREKDERKFHVVNKFNQITYWNWDKIPTSQSNSGRIKEALLQKEVKKL